MPDLITPKVTTVVAAALETAGATIQSDMLDFVVSGSGQTLAGVLYLIAIIGAIIAFASGGNYRWARYLLIGPPLFFFLTTVRTDSDGTEWSFGGKEFSQEAVEKALRGVDSPKSGGGTKVAFVYHFWNVFMSEVTQELIKLLNLTQTDSQFTFIQKVERYMANWNFSNIKDPNLRTLIRFTLGSQCKDYFEHLRTAHNPHVLTPVRENARQMLAQLKDKPVLAVHEDGISDIVSSEISQWLVKEGLANKTFTCQSMWEALINPARKDVYDTLQRNMTVNLAPEQDAGVSMQTFFDKSKSITELYSGNSEDFVLTDEFNNDNSNALQAIDWIVARSLHHEIWAVNNTVQELSMGGDSNFYQHGSEKFIPGQASSYNEDPSKSIQQFNVTDMYAQRGEFVNAALSLPYFQGVGLLLLSASYPFFAMLVVMPGRALGFFSWLGLWAWLKLWDFGFAVVMMIDNILFAMFPRGPGLTANDTKNAGIAWAKVLEVDPNYSQAVYYNLIGTCMFAVPLVTGIFVKGGGGELINMINQGWSTYTMRMAGAAASYARSYQAQGYMASLQRQVYKSVEEAGRDFITKSAGQRAEIAELAKIREMTDLSAANEILGTTFSDIQLLQKYADTQIHNLETRLNLEREAVLFEAAYKAEMTHGRYASNRAVASRYYSHELVVYRDNHFQSIAKADAAREYSDITKYGEAATGFLFNVGKTGANLVGGGSTK